MLISIITINYNNLEGLKTTVKSVINQTYTNIEYIVVDGASDDGSKEFIEKNSMKMTRWVSEPDNGIYHAMNKGIDLTTGEYLLFLNSGDWLADTKVIEKFIAFKPNKDIVYGDPLVRNGNKWVRKHMPKQLNVSTALTHTLSHQAQFYNKSVFKNNYRYDTSYKIISDWIFTTNAILFKNCSSCKIDLVICHFEKPGISDDFNLRKEERNRYLNDNFNPEFLDLLKAYKALNRELKILKSNQSINLFKRILQKWRKF